MIETIYGYDLVCYAYVKLIERQDKWIDNQLVKIKWDRKPVIDKDKEMRSRIKSWHQPNDLINRFIQNAPRSRSNGFGNVHKFNECGLRNDLFDAFIKYHYGGVDNVMDKTRISCEMADEFIEWFGKFRRRFREDMTTEMVKLNAKIERLGKRPQAHGGVANLLKTLTRTMEKQGADIRSIAKVQYAVCTQAGIFIPDEFIEDVAVALTIIEEEAE